MRSEVEAIIQMREEHVTSVNIKTNKSVIERFSFQAPSLLDNAAGETANRDIVVYLPPSYEASPDCFYPIVYVLHGYDASPESWFMHVEGELALNDIMDSLIASGEVEEMILVAVDGTNSLFGNWYLNSEVSGNAMDYVAKDLIAEVESRYRACGDKRALFGHSMGGFGAFNTAFHFPNTYQAVAALSPAVMMLVPHAHQAHAEFFGDQIRLYYNDEEVAWFITAYLSILRSVAPNADNAPSFVATNMKEAMAALEALGLSQLSKTHARNVGSLPFYTEIGTQEDDVFGMPVLTQFEQMVATMKENGLNITHTTFEGGHVDKMTDQITRALTFIGPFIR
ncbi:alpha/beta hydrolase [Enterovibrio baiacu]|uniref:alpha/beta hydrolase n=1 Tax=Enterovibrio baiacu TaxID=2491023 RepID=UPI003D1278A2